MHDSDEPAEDVNTPHVWAFPVTFAIDWCGEFEPKEAEESS
jgi:hypothetical protein